LKTWYGKSGIKGLTTSATTEIHADGTFEAKNFPEVFMTPAEVPLASVVDGTGEWKLDSYSGSQTLILGFGTSGPYMGGRNSSSTPRIQIVHPINSSVTQTFFSGTVLFATSDQIAQRKSKGRRLSQRGSSACVAYADEQQENWLR
jgi:hypothetical protein